VAKWDAGEAPPISRYDSVKRFQGVFFGKSLKTGEIEFANRLHLAMPPLLDRHQDG
jgi:hypothetical protein